MASDEPEALHEYPAGSGPYGDYPAGDRLFVRFLGQDKGLWKGCDRTVGPNEAIIRFFLGTATRVLG